MTMSLCLCRRALQAEIAGSTFTKDSGLMEDTGGQGWVLPAGARRQRAGQGQVGVWHRQAPMPHAHPKAQTDPLSSGPTQPTNPPRHMGH